MPWRGEFAALLTLALCWAATLSASCLLVSIAPLAAKRLGASKTLAPFTCGTFLLGAAVVSAPSAPLFRALGRRGAFVSGAAVGVLGGILGTLATIYRLHASLLFAACALVGLAQGMGQFYRFAALEVCPPHRKPLAVTLVLSGGVIAAFAGPQLAIVTRDLGRRSGAVSVGPTDRTEAAHEFVGAFAAIVALHLLNAALSLAVCLPRTRTSEPEPLLLERQEALLRQPQQAEISPSSEGVAVAAESAASGCDNARGACGAHPSASSKPPSSLGESRHIPTADAASSASAAPTTASSTAPSLLELLRRPGCATAIAIGTLAQTAMVVLMSPLALAMDELGFEPWARTLTYELHCARARRQCPAQIALPRPYNLAAAVRTPARTRQGERTLPQRAALHCSPPLAVASMYAPGLLTAQLIDWLGLLSTAALGASTLGCACAVLASEASRARFMSGMALCGVGWNLSFSSATLLLDATCSHESATTMQAANDFVVFVVSAVGSLGSGYVYEYAGSSASDGWHAVVYAAAALAALNAPLLAARLLASCSCHGWCARTQLQGAEDGATA